MRSLLRYTLDLFEPFEAVAPVHTAQAAPDLIATKAPGVPHVETQRLGQVIAPATFSHPQGNRQVRLGDAVVGYHFLRASRRTIGFMVGPDGLTVRAPRWTPLMEVEAALQEKADWIVRKLGESRERLARQEGARIVWAHGTELPFLGEPVTLCLDPGHRFAAAGAQLDDAPSTASAAQAGAPRNLRLALAQSAQPEQIRDAVQAWLMRQAKANFQQRLEFFAPQLQVQWSQLRLSSAGTRWGSAKSDGSIRLNWRLIHFRQPVIDYVVVHELSHLRVMDHSPRFWDTVRSVVPDYASLRGQLKDDAVPRW